MSIRQAKAYVGGTNTVHAPAFDTGVLADSVIVAAIAETFDTITGVSSLVDSQGGEHPAQWASDGFVLPSSNSCITSLYSKVSPSSSALTVTVTFSTAIPVAIFLWELLGRSHPGRTAAHTGFDFIGDATTPSHSIGVVAGDDVLAVLASKYGSAPTGTQAPFTPVLNAGVPFTNSWQFESAAQAESRPVGTATVTWTPVGGYFADWAVSMLRLPASAGGGGGTSTRLERSRRGVLRGVLRGV